MGPILRFSDWDELYTITVYRISPHSSGRRRKLLLKVGSFRYRFLVHQLAGLWLFVMVSWSYLTADNYPVRSEDDRLSRLSSELHYCHQLGIITLPPDSLFFDLFFHRVRFCMNFYSTRYSESPWMLYLNWLFMFHLALLLSWHSRSTYFSFSWKACQIMKITDLAFFTLPVTPT